MSKDETDPGASTDRFRAFVEGGEAGHVKQRRRPGAAIGIISLLLLLALVVLLWLFAAS